MRLPGRRIGLVGGIAAGKSTAARWFAARGWTILDADAQAHALYAPGAALNAAVRERFGAELALPDGSIDRRALGARVFGDPAALKELEAMVHPAVRERLAARVEEARRRDEPLVLEMALLSRWPEMVAQLDFVLGIRATEETRVGRLRSRNALGEDEARARLDRQEPQERLLACADRILENDGTPEALETALRELFHDGAASP